MFSLVQLDKHWTLSEILEEIEINPERFSPNVLMRPLYQEFLFPNVAFIGGGGEIAYWLQLKKCFDLMDLPFPILFRRFSAFHFDNKLIQKINKLDLLAEELLQPLQQIESNLVNQETETHVLDQADFKLLYTTLSKIKQDAHALDPSTKMSIESEIQKILKSLDHIENKHTKAVKLKLESKLQMLRKIKMQLFPDHSIQERYDNFLPVYFAYGKEYLDYLIQLYNPGLHELYLINE